MHNLFFKAPRTVTAIVLLALLNHGSLNAQTNHSNEELKNMTFGQRLYYGGGLGATFGTITSVQVSPRIGYRIMHRWSAGVGVHYQYYKDNRFPSFDTHIYGGNLHTRVYIWDNIYAQSEFEVLSLETQDYLGYGAEYSITRRNIPALFIGAGYFMPIGQRSGIGITFLYDLLQDIYSPYPQNFVFRIGIAL